MLIDPVLGHVEKRIKDTMWSFEGFDSMTAHQIAAVNELIQSALTHTRKHFENAVIGIEE